MRTIHRSDQVTARAWIHPSKREATAAGLTLMAVLEEPDVRSLLAGGCTWLGHGVMGKQGFVVFAYCDTVQGLPEILSLFEEIMEKDLGALRAQGDVAEVLETEAKATLDKHPSNPAVKTGKCYQYDFYDEGNDISKFLHLKSELIRFAQPLKV